MVFRRLSAAMLVLATLACSKDRGTDPTEESVYQIAIQGGDDQQGAAGSILALPLQIKVTDPAGDPVRSVAVVFRPAAQSGVTLSDTVVGTGIDGIARVDVRLGSQQGEYTIAAAFVRGQDENMETFTATGTPGPTLTGSSKQSTQAGDTITLTGTSFNSSAAGNSVFFGSARARIINATASSITIIVPPCVSPGAVPLVVEVGTARTSSINITYVQTSPTLSLALYEGITISGTELGNCLRLPGDGASYLVVPQFASASVPLATHSFLLGNSSTPVPQSLSAALDRSVREGATSLQSRFDLALRAAERRMPVPTAAELAANRPISLEALTLNSTRDFRVLCSLDPEETCFKTAKAKLKHIGQNVLVYIDEKSPSNGLTDSELTNFGKLFDETLYPIDLRTFGPESDIDGNG
ncbi:MAG: IPT/TIG domain-containing protein, partial [Gemmatimonadota bacterium]|nr:IPT/TIG domain-containing protein [Gemmatimonadota bacterium]